MVTEVNQVKKSATTIFKSYEHGKDHKEVFPVDCEFIAKGFGITVVGEALGDKFEACLYLSGDVKAIIYNTEISSTSRINFTIGHELGHYFLHRKSGDKRCSLSDLENIGALPPHTSDIEREANLFSASLLMPAPDFCAQIKNQLPDISLVSTLTKRYGTSLLATLYRLKELSSKPIAVLFVGNDNRVISVWKNKLFASLYFPPNTQIEEMPTSQTLLETTLDQLGIESSACQHILYQSSVNYRFNDMRIFLVTGEPT